MYDFIERIGIIAIFVAFILYIIEFLNIIMN